MLLKYFSRNSGHDAHAAPSLGPLPRCQNAEHRLRTATYEDTGQTPALEVTLPHKPFPMLLPHADVNVPRGDDVAG